MPLPLLTVFGASGAQGGSLARALLPAGGGARRWRVRAVTRRPGEAEALAALGAEIIEGDLDDAASVQRAMHGAHGAFCMTDYFAHGSPAREVRQAGHLAEGARREGVQHVVWSTMEDTRRFSRFSRFAPVDGRPLPPRERPGRVPCFDGKGEADRQFTERGLPLTRLLTSFQWENLLRRGLGPRRGAVGRTVGLAGEHLGGAQMAAAFTRVLGEPVAWQPLSAEAWARLPLPAAADWAAALHFQSEFSGPVCAARPVAATRALHPGLLGFEAWLRGTRFAWPATAR